MGDMLFVMIIQPCYFFPSQIESSIGCSCCGGSKFVRVKDARNCCLALQVLFLSDVEYGWTLLDPPPVHYSASKGSLPHMWVDETDKMLYIVGGLSVAVKSGHETVREPVLGGYMLHLKYATNQFVYNKNLKPRERDRMGSLEKVIVHHRR